MYGEGEWKAILKESVTFLSCDIDGLKIYSINSLRCAELSESLRDGRPWEKDTKTQWKMVRYNDRLKWLFLLPK